MTDSSVPGEDQPAEFLAGTEDTGLRYYVKLAHELDAALPDKGITFLFTWHLDGFEDRFCDSVVILVGDEKHQTPSYAPAVRAIFKTGGIRPNPGRTMLRLAPSVAWRVALRELRDAVFAYRRRLAGVRTGGTPMFELPLGYYRLVDVPFVPFVDRPVDVFFAGSIERTTGFTMRPRLAARRQMTAALAEARHQLPNLRVDCTSSGPFANPERMLDAEDYSTRLMQAKVALCPRGNFDETFRVIEAAKAGCVAIVERLPDRWYYRDAPVIQIDRWRSLPQILEMILSDPHALAERSDQMRRWWDTSLSEVAVARSIASSVKGDARPSQSSTVSAA